MQVGVQQLPEMLMLSGSQQEEEIPGSHKVVCCVFHNESTRFPDFSDKSHKSSTVVEHIIKNKYGLPPVAGSHLLALWEQIYASAKQME